MPVKSLHQLHPMHAFGVVTNLDTPLRIQRFENRVEPLIPFPHKHNFYHLVFVVSGKGWHEIDFQRYPIEPGRFFIMKPAQVHAWVVEKAKGYVIEFEEDLVFSHTPHSHKIRNLLSRMPDSFKVSEKCLRDIRVQCENMLTEYSEQNNQYDLVLTLSLFLILAKAFREVPSQDPSLQQSSLTDKFLQLIEENYNKQHDVEFYARKMNMSAKALTMKVSRRLGKSARTLVQERCLLEGKRLLAYSDLSVGEIAETLGYEDPNYFSRFFRMKTKKTPLAFRKAAKKVL
ncbi:helix-turn-helix domain-containing protein [Bdellovibrio sp. 22V]|uniref:helix-turn-helix domain-containing protein n=1 Tax=Bdellovibrio TaxID=958 RepID=UPI002542C7B6|nr:helix-turn-helix domain-containing protein [Bdellovibrio sp. 22V]WII72854.1 helix-turn-helix domain-containing protein [Bdellovibrio sp. 22V]